MLSRALVFPIIKIFFQKIFIIETTTVSRGNCVGTRASEHECAASCRGYMNGDDVCSMLSAKGSTVFYEQFPSVCEYDGNTDRTFRRT